MSNVCKLQKKNKLTYATKQHSIVAIALMVHFEIWLHKMKHVAEISSVLIFVPEYYKQYVGSE